MKLFSTEFICGSDINECFIGHSDFKLMQDFANLPPQAEEPIELPDVVKYDIFPSQLCSPRLENAQYSIQTNLSTGVLDLQIKQHVKTSRPLYLLLPSIKGGFVKLIYSQLEDKSEDNLFLLNSNSKGQHCFKNIEIHRDRKRYRFIYNKRVWFMLFETVYSYPQYDEQLKDGYLHFTKPPKYSVRIWTNEIVPISSAMQAIKLMIPCCYHNNQTRWFR